MSLTLKGMSVAVAVAGLVAMAVAAGGYLAGARINTTKSIPVGLYWTSSAPVEKGAYVLWCPPAAGLFDAAKDRGYIGAGVCTGGYGYMMKRVLAAKDDVISVSDDGVRINGLLVPQSKPIQADKSGRQLPRFRINEYRLTGNEVLLMSDASATSFDGRYFGPIERAQVQTAIRPVFTW